MAKDKVEKVKTTFAFDPELIKKFKTACAKKGITMTEVFVKAMEQTIKSK